MTQPATILLAPQRMGYGVCGAVPPQLYVTAAQNLYITSISDDGASSGYESVADVPCPGAPSVRGWSMGLVVCCRHGAAAALSGMTVVSMPSGTACTLPRHDIFGTLCC